MRSIVDTLIHVVRPDNAFALATGAIDILLLPEMLEEYSGRIIIQTGLYASDSDEAEAIANFRILLSGTTFGDTNTEELCPQQSFIGWVKTQGKYRVYDVCDQESFAADADRHQMGDNLQLLSAQQGITRLYGLELSDPVFLTRPVEDVPGGDRNGGFYFPETEFQELCVKLAFSKDRKPISANGAEADDDED